MPTAHTDPAGLSVTCLMMYSVEPLIVGGLHDVPRHLRVHDDADAGMLLAGCSRSASTVKRACTEQWPFHRIMRARFDRVGIDAAADLVRIPHHHLVERHAHLVGGVAAEVLIGQEQDPVAALPGPAQRRRRVGRRADDAAALADRTPSSAAAELM